MEKKYRIIIFNNYINKKKYFIKSNINCENKIKLINISFDLKNIEFSINLSNKNELINKKKFKNYERLIN